MARRLLAYALLLFALASVITLVVKGVRARAVPPQTANAAEARADRVVVYYLYGNIRCATCKGMEALTKAAATAAFPKELADKTLESRTENFETPGNEHFGKDYGVVAPSVVLTKTEGGKVVRWKNLKDIWDLYESPDRFQAYIQKETTAFLRGEGDTPVAAPAADASFGALMLAALTAVMLGLLTAISPCPLATNVAAISFLSKRVDSTRRVLLSGLCYAVGRIAAYVALGAILVAGLLSAPGVAAFLGKYINSLLGPILVVAGVLLLELLELSWGNLFSAEKLQSRAEKGGYWTALLLGLVFALAFCPTSAALFFGGLIPLAVKTQSSVLLPGAYGFATGLPVVVFAILIAVASQAVGRWFGRLSQIDLWMRRVAGVLFIGVGAYYSLIYIYA
jgi:cytochrome c biogenesis protein CcdA